MYLLFLDESGTPPSREKAEGKFFVIGGVIIHHEHFNEVFGQFEALNTAIKNLKKEFGMVFSDHRMSHEDRALRTWHHEITDYSFRGRMRDNLIIGSLHFIPSEFSPFLQIADMVSGALFQKHQRKYDHYYNILSSSFLLPKEKKQNELINKRLWKFSGLIEFLSSGGEV